MELLKSVLTAKQGGEEALLFLFFTGNLSLGRFGGSGSLYGLFCYGLGGALVARLSLRSVTAGCSVASAFTGASVASAFAASAASALTGTSVASGSLVALLVGAFVGFVGAWAKRDRMKAMAEYEKKQKIGKNKNKNKNKK